MFKDGVYSMIIQERLTEACQQFGLVDRLYLTRQIW